MPGTPERSHEGMRLLAVHAHPDDESSKGAATVAKYVAAGSRPFHYRRADGRSTVMQYHEVPEDVLDDPDLACAWAYEAAATPA